MSSLNVAVVGATGLVGRKLLQVLEERRFPVAELRLLASARSAGRSMKFNGKEYPVRKLESGSFEGVELALFSAGAFGNGAIVRYTPLGKFLPHHRTNSPMNIMYCLTSSRHN